MKQKDFEELLLLNFTENFYELFYDRIKKSQKGHGWLLREAQKDIPGNLSLQCFIKPEYLII
jgi:hypothetical protein